jgi:hypothetical protein
MLDIMLRAICISSCADFRCSLHCPLTRRRTRSALVVLPLVLQVVSHLSPRYLFACSKLLPLETPSDMLFFACVFFL